MKDFCYSAHRLIPINAIYVLAILALTLVLTGCINIKVRAGESVKVEDLDSLKIGISTADDVRSLIGDPFGIGRSQLTMQEEPVEMWSYYYALGTLSDTRGTSLFVYLDDGIYDGYMWFSSLPETLE